jgi:hypothetical protein
VDHCTQHRDLLLQPVPQLLLLLLVLMKPVQLKLIHLFLSQRMALLVHLIFNHRTPLHYLLVGPWVLRPS